MDTDAKIFVAGHNGLVGSAIAGALADRGYRNLILRSRAELDLTNQAAVDAFFAQERPEYVFMCAAKVGGVLANRSFPAEFIGINLKIQTNVIDAAWRFGTARFLFMGSSCVYPRVPTIPTPETDLLTGPLEPTNEWYAVAKIAGLKMCQAYRTQYGFDAITVMPANLYGPGDNFDYETSHVLPALIRKFHDAKVSGAPTVTVWGSGTPRREFLHTDDVADACLFLMNADSPPDTVNIGAGSNVSIAELADIIRTTVGYTGDIVYDPGKPDGTPEKCVDTSRLNAMGWSPRVTLAEGIARTYEWFLDNLGAVRELRLTD